MRRRADTPLAIVVMGIFTVVMFGGAVIYFSGKTPILQLVPELEQRYETTGFVTRFNPGTAPWIEVAAPAQAAPDEAALTDLAVFSLEAYRRIAGPTTRVEVCVARVKDEPLRHARVNLELAGRLAHARAAVREIEVTVQRAGLSSPSVEVTGLARTGAAVRVTARTQRPDAAALADRAVAAVGSLTYVGRVDLTLEGPSGRLDRAGGRDRAPER
ncbi:MAG: hypothetical protein M9894_29045 [Planctomycetes bacterium]|nr:hypothetical protein [Planctomycetota bacterium]